MSDTKYIVTMTNHKENSLDFELESDGLAIGDAEVHFIIEAGDMNLMFYATKMKDTARKWEVVVPPLEMLKKSKYPFKITLAAEGYYFEVMSGEVNLITKSSVKMANLNKDEKKDDKKEEKKPKAKKETKKKEVKEATTLIEEVEKDTSFAKEVIKEIITPETEAPQKLDESKEKDEIVKKALAESAGRLRDKKDNQRKIEQRIKAQVKTEKVESKPPVLTKADEAVTKILKEKIETKPVVTKKEIKHDTIIPGLKKVDEAAKPEVKPEPEKKPVKSEQDETVAKILEDVKAPEVIPPKENLLKKKGVVVN